jgi:hypothetical protein
MKVINHPNRAGYWTIKIGNSIYGCYDRKSLAITILLTM